MKVVTRHSDSLPDTASHDIKDGSPQQIWYGESPYVRAFAVSDHTPAIGASSQGSLSAFARQKGVRPAQGVEWDDQVDRVWPANVFRYWFAYPADLQSRMQTFAEAALSGTLPSTWVEKDAEDASGDAHIVTTVDASFSMARSWGKIQPIAEGALASKVAFYQTIVPELYDISALGLRSEQPSDRGEKRDYAEGELYQSNDVDVGGHRGEQWAEQDVLDQNDLTLI